MMDPFNIPGDEFATPPSFDQAVRDLVARFEKSAARFEALYTAVPPEQFTEDEWRVVEQTAAELEAAVERADEGYVAVQYDSHAWYRITENLETIHLRLESAISLMEHAQARANPSSAG